MALAFRTTQMRQLNRDQRALLPRRNPARAVRCQALRRCSDAVAPKPSSTSSPAAEAPEAASLAPSRRQLLAVPAAAAAALSLGFWRPASASAEAAGITIDADEPGVGEAAARAGDLVLIHYTGTIADTGVVFDSTLGLGLTYRDGGPGALRPLALRLGGSPVPGVCAGLQAALLGMTVGGRRVVAVPPELGFGDRPALAPYGIVPAGSGVRYEVQLLRLSRRGPDALFKGLSKCSQGGASATAENCASITPAEFV